jgi:molybdopterin molybdotransferase
MLSLEDARRKVIDVAAASRQPAAAETVNLADASGRVLAEAIFADRDYPPFDRSTRDGFAVRSADATPGAKLRRIGELAAGRGFDHTISSGECAQIMTGAALPASADAVVMMEHARVSDDHVELEREARPGKNVVPCGSEAHTGQELLSPGARLGYAESALAAQVGCSRISVFARPRVAVLSTGDEVVDVDKAPGPYQIRNSNEVALETLVRLAGGVPEPLGTAPDEKRELRKRIERGLASDMLVISGGVSMGKYDLVEGVLAELGTEVCFDGVAMRPGRPTFLGRCRGKLVFGLPGNPLSTMVTFQLFVIPAMDLLGGTEARPLPVLRARLAHEVHERGELAHVLPARTEYAGAEPRVSLVKWQGSGDIAALARANAFLLIPPEKLDWAEGESAMVLPRIGVGGMFC